MQPKPSHAWAAERYDVSDAAQPHVDSEGYQMPVAGNATGYVYAEQSGGEMQPYGNDTKKKKEANESNGTNAQNRDSAINPVYELPRYNDVMLGSANGSSPPVLPPRADSGPQRPASGRVGDHGYGYVCVGSELAGEDGVSRSSSVGSSYLEVEASCDA